MRMIVTLDPDTEQLVRRRMRERGLSFNEALNAAIRSGAQEPCEEFRTPTASLGRPSVSLDRALTLAGELEDEELLRKQRTGS